MRQPKQDITPRRFTSGDNFELGAVRFRVERGSKSPDDLRMDWNVNGRWVAVPMSALFLLTDFLWENEHVLYPPSSGNQGGEKLFEALRRARNHGWEAATGYLEAERRALHCQSQFDLYGAHR